MKLILRLWALVLLVVVLGCRTPADPPTVEGPTETPSPLESIEVVTPMANPSRTTTPELLTPRPLVEFITPQGPATTVGSGAPRVPSTLVPTLTPRPPSGLSWRIRSANVAEIAIYQALSDEIDADSAEINLTFDVANLNYIDSLRAENMAGTAPDVFWLPGTHLADFVRDGLIKDLYGYAEDSAEFDLADFYVGPMLHLTHDPRTGQSGGRLWGLPRDVSTLVLYLNLDLIEESGADDPRELATRGAWNWDSFVDVATATSESDEDRYGFGQYGWWGTHGYWIQAAGGDYFNAKQNGCALDSAETIAGLRFERDLYRDGLAVPITEAPDAAFYGGRVAMYLSGRWQTPSTREDADFEWDVVELPEGPARNFNYLTWGAYVVSAKTKHPEAAWDLIEQLTSTDVQNKLADSGLAIPSRLDPTAIERFLAAIPPDNAQAFLTGINNNTVAETPLWAGDWDRWDNTVNSALHRVFAERLSLEAFAATICKEANDAFDADSAESVSTK